MVRGDKEDKFFAVIFWIIFWISYTLYLGLGGRASQYRIRRTLNVVRSSVCCCGAALLTGVLC